MNQLGSAAVYQNVLYVTVAKAQYVSNCDMDNTQNRGITVSQTAYILHSN